MTSFFYRLRMTLPAMGLFILAAGAAPVSYAATVDYSNGGHEMFFADPTCAEFELSGSPGNHTLSCKTTGGGGDPAPSGCSITAPSSNFTMADSSGGPLTLTGLCSTNAGSAQYTWTRTGGGLSQETYSGASPAGVTVPANTNTNASNTFTYTLTAKNTNSTTTTVGSRLVTVPAAQGSGGNSCAAGYTPPTLVWNGVALKMNAGATGVVAAKFTVPSGYELGKISVAEDGTGPYERTITISPNACDFSPQTALISQITATFVKTFMPAENKWKYPLISSGTYYINIKNINSFGTSSCPSGSCAMTVRLEGY